MRSLLLCLAALPFLACSSTGTARDRADGWELDTRIVESCCCDVVCPCVLGGAPTHGMCVGNRLVRIESGRLGEETLEDVTLIVTFHIGSWTRLWFDDEVEPARRDAAVELLRRAGGFVYGELLSVESVSLEVAWSEERVAYASPTTRTEIEPVRGREGRPVELRNLRGFEDYVQYRSVVVAHEPVDGEGAFEHSGTNGFTARIRRSGS